MLNIFIGEILISEGLISLEQLQEALQKQKKILEESSLPEFRQRAKLVSEARMASGTAGLPLLGQILVKMGVTSEEQIRTVLQKQQKQNIAYNLLDQEKLKIILEICLLMNSTSNLAKLLEIIMENVNKMLKCNASSILMLDDKTDELIMSIPTGPGADKIIDIHIPPGAGIAGWVAKYELPLRIENAQNDKRFYSEIDQLSKVETKSIICVPIKIKTKLIGVLEAMNRIDGTSFSYEDEILLTIVACHVAQAIESVRLYQELENHLQQSELDRKALRESEKQKKAIIDGIKANLVYIDKDLNVLWANEAAVHRIDKVPENVKGFKCYELWSGMDKPCRKCPVVLSFKSRKTEFANIRTDYGKMLELRAEPIFDEHGNISGVLEIGNDITEKTYLESQLIKSHKMESIGTLAGGVVHDFNNILYPIIGFTEMARESLPPGSLADNELKEVLNAANRARDLIRQILHFSRQKEEGIKPIRFQEVVIESIKMLRAMIPATITIHQSIDDLCGYIIANFTQIQQVVMNLCINAYQSMQESGGHLEILLSEITVGETNPVKAGLNPGVYFVLTVADTGKGIEKTDLEHIFEAYYTTKENGMGTGLGLSVVYGIVKKYKGEILVESEKGIGTVFQVYLPKTDASDYIVPIEISKVEKVVGGNEHVLVIDDNEQNVKVMKATLERLGYKVSTARNGLDLLGMFKKHPNDYDIMITDYTMPQMTGIQIAENVLRIRPEMPIILYTGYNDEINEEEIKAMGIKEYLLKPIEKHELAGVIRKILDNEPR